MNVLTDKLMVTFGQIAKGGYNTDKAINTNGFHMVRMQKAFCWQGLEFSHYAEYKLISAHSAFSNGAKVKSVLFYRLYC